MGSESKINHPVIDFRNLKPGTPEWETTKKQVREASEEYGFFEALFDQVPQDLRKSTYDGLKQLFDLPLETKIQAKTDKPYYGFVKTPHTPLYEAFIIEDALTPGKTESFLKLMGPQGEDLPVSKSLVSYSEQLSKIDKVVREMIAESLGLEKYINDHFESTKYHVSVQKYKGPESDEGKIGMPSHVDDNFVTILSSNEVSGLQFWTKDGNQWISIDMPPNSFVVVLGKSLHAWTNGRTHAPHHRVMMTGEVDRYSIALFAIAKRGHMIKAPQEMVDEQHPLLFKPFDFFEYLDYCFSGTNQRSGISLKSYCGA